MRTGVFPDPDGEEFLLRQEEYVKNRKKGLYNPLSPSPVLAPLLDPNTKYSIDNQKTAETSTPKAKSKKNMASSGRPRDSQTAKASVDDIKTTVYATESLLSFISAKIKEKHNVEYLNEFQSQMVNNLMIKVISSAMKGEWESLASSCIDDNNNILKLTPLDGVQEVSAEHNLSEHEAALLFHSQQSY